jgi:trehalose 6-phosphate phosphatase
MAAAPERSGELAAALEPLRSNPARTAVFTDFDGTLAPIVKRPGEAVIPPQTREALAALAGRYALVGCISGRRAVEVRRMVGLEGLTYIGNHGFERILPGEDAAVPDPVVGDHAGTALSYVSRLDRRRLEEVGLRLEDKGPIQALHWRGAPDEAEAEREARRIAADAAARGLVPHFGRKVLEVRPAVAIEKGTALAELLEERRLEHCLYAGDDRADVSAFTILRQMQRAGDLIDAVCVGIASPESPREVRDEADLVVATPEDFLEVLRLLAA